ncbi:hypothetical protein ACO0QE_000385 [Hanseniaspora vineae]
MSEYLKALTDKLVFPIDFPSQEYVEVITNKILLIGLFSSCVFGLYTSSVINAFIFYGTTVVIALLLVIPPYPSYNEHKLTWATPVKEKTNHSFVTSNANKKGVQYTTGFIKTDVEIEIAE